MGTTSLQNVTSPIRVYQVGISTGSASPLPVEFVDDSPNLQCLDSYPIERVFEVRSFNARDATQRWGTGHTGGVIEIIAGTPNAPDRRPEPEPGTDDPNAVTRMHSSGSSSSIRGTTHSVSG